MNSSNYRWIQSPVGVFVLLFVLALACYAWVLPTPFTTVDDNVSIVENPLIHESARFKEIFTTSFFGDHAYYRPLVTLSFWMELKMFGLNPIFFNFFNILLHVLNGWLIYWIFRRVSRDGMLALLTAVIFVVHPIQWEAVANIAGRSILLCSFFGLGSFGLFLVYMQASRGRWAALVGSAMALALALLCKESAFVFPAVAVAYCFLFRKGLPDKIIRRWSVLIVYGAVVLVFLIWRQYLGITAVSGWGNAGQMFLGVTTFLGTLLEQGMCLLVPLTSHSDRSAPLFVSLGDPQVWTVWVFWWILLGIFVWVLRRRSVLVDFGAAWFVIHLLPVAQLVPIRISPERILAADHFYYLPSAGLFVGIVIGARFLIAKWTKQHKIRRGFVQAIVAGYIVFLVMGSIQRSFENVPGLDSSGHPYVLFNVAERSVVLGDTEKAEMLYQRLLDSGVDDGELRGRAGDQLRSHESVLNEEND